MSFLKEYYDKLKKWMDEPLFDPVARSEYILQQEKAIVVLEIRRQEGTIGASEYFKQKKRHENNIEFHNNYVDQWDIYGDLIENVIFSAVGGGIFKGLSSTVKVMKKGLSYTANFAQKTFNSKFSIEGIKYYTNLAGYEIKTIDDLASAIQGGTIKLDKLSVEIIVRDGQEYILNTRTVAALRKAGVDRKDFVVKDVTGDKLKEKLLDGQFSRNKDIPEKGFSEVRRSYTKDDFIRCFSAGTHIDMANGTQKPIETIEIGDEVLAYDPEANAGLGELRSGTVTRTMTNIVDEIIDFHGMKVTPGHATLCCDGPNAGRHIPLMDIIMADGAVANRDGTVIRAATNLPVGCEGDQFVTVAYILDKSQETYFKGKMRLGTLMAGMDGKDDWRVINALKREGYRIFPDGLIAKDGEAPHPLYWFGEVPRPHDYILKKSALTVAGLYSGDGQQVGSNNIPSHAGMTVQ